MGHLLLVESWVGSMSRLLPRAIAEGGHHFTFLTRDLHHYLRQAPAEGTPPLLGARNVVTADTNDTAGVVSHAARLHQVLGFDGVLTSCDYYLPTAARIAARLGLPGPAPEAVDAACRKDTTRQRLTGAGVPGPGYAVCHDRAQTAAAARALGYPVVLKPVDLCAGMLVRRVDDEEALERAYRAIADFPVNARGQRRAPAVLVEELLTGPEVSVETVTFDGVTHVVGVTGKSVGGAPSFVETGHQFPAPPYTEGGGGAADTEGAERTAVAAVRALGLDQVVAHTEVKLTPAGPRLVEVNPRPAGNRITELVRHVTGIDLPAAAVDVALGRRPDLVERPTGVRSAAIGFVVADQDGVLEGFEGAERLEGLDRSAGVLEVDLAPPGRPVRAATSNNEYLGHVMAADTGGLAAHERVDALLAGLRPRCTPRAGERS